MKKRILSILLAAVMIFAILPMGAMAAESSKCGDNLTWSVKNDVLTISGTGDMWDYEWNTQPYPHSIKQVVIKSGVTSIGDYAFYFFPDSLTSVTIPDSVTEIGDAAFMNCFGLTSMTIPGSVKSIGDNAFTWCYSLTSLKLGKGVTEIGDYAFSNCTGLTSVTIPNSVREIGDYAFVGCNGLKSIAMLDGVREIGDYAFANCTGLTSVIIPNSVTSIGHSAFASSGLKSVTIPDSVKSIGSAAFVGCSGLADSKGFVIFRNVLYYYCGDAAVVTVPETVTEISDAALSGYTKMTSVRIPVSVKRIGYGAFCWCDGLKDVYYGGSKSQWNKIEIAPYNEGVDNDCLLNAAKHYNSYALGISTQPESVSKVANLDATFSVKAFGSGLTYQWQYKKAGETTWSNSSSEGAKTASLTVKALAYRDGQQYRCVVKDSKGNKATSDAATLTVVSPKITIQPKSCIKTLDSYAEFKVAATGVRLKYQWQFSTDGGKTWSKSSQWGATTDTLPVEVKSYRDGYMYRCVITDTAGNKLTSNAAKLTISKLAITKQPESCVAPVNGSAVFSVSAKGDGLKYQWMYSSNDGRVWSASSQADAKTDTLTVAAKRYRNGYTYFCIVTDAYGNRVDSHPAKLTITVVTAQPQSVSAKSGETVTFSVKTAGSGYGYRWQFSKDGGKTWSNSSQADANTDTLAVAVKSYRDGYMYRCKIWDGDGNIYSPSDAAKLTVK